MRLAGALLAAAAALAAPAASAGGRRAVIVGSNDGGPALEALRYAERDADRVAALLAELGGFDPRALDVLHHPTPEAVRRALRRAAGEPADVFLFYYSGHADQRGLRLGGEVLPYAELKAAIRAVPADVRLGVLDACRSGAITRVKGGRVVDPFLDDIGTTAEGEAWLAASAADEDAQESDEVGGSFFTHYLVTGLRGAADDGDGYVSLSEAYAFAYDRTVHRTGGTLAGPQHPAYDFQLQGQGDLRLTMLDRARAWLRLPAGLSGEVAVFRLPGQEPVAELGKAPGREVRLALAPGRYLVRLAGEEERREALVVLEEGEVGEPAGWSRAVAEAGRRKGAALPGHPVPAVAGFASALLPGAGQAYDRRWVAAGLTTTSFLVLATYGASLAPDDPQPVRLGAAGLNPLLLGSAMVYGWSIANASRRAADARVEREATGLALAFDAAWTDATLAPAAAGLSVDAAIAPGFAMGLDRLGWRWSPDEPLDLQGGLRVLAGPAWNRIQPAALFASGLQLLVPPGGEAELVPHLAVGVHLRWHHASRYFSLVEARWVKTGDTWDLLASAGMGVQLRAPWSRPR